MSQMGEYIRCAKAIYEDKYGFVTETNVREWVKHTKEVQTYLKMDSFEQVIQYLKLTPEKIGK